MASTMFLATVMLIMLTVQSSSALNIVATTFPNPGPNKANTFIAPSDAIGSSILDSGVASLLWLIMKSSDVTAMCQQIVGSGSPSFSVTVIDSTSGSQTDVTMTVCIIRSKSTIVVGILCLLGNEQLIRHGTLSI